MFFSFSLHYSHASRVRKPSLLPSQLLLYSIVTVTLTLRSLYNVQKLLLVLMLSILASHGTTISIISTAVIRLVDHYYYHDYIIVIVVYVLFCFRLVVNCLVTTTKKFSTSSLKRLWLRLQ